MADAYWRYGDGRQQPAAIPTHVVKRPRSEFEMPGNHDMPNFYAREDDRSGLRAIRDTDSINASYDRYLRSAQMSSFGGDSGRSISSGLGGHHHVDDPRVMAMGGSDPAAAAKSRPIGLGGRPEIPLPPDASSTLFVEGLPANIFRPFVGYKEVRLVTKESRHPGGDPLVLCFVDFQSPAHAATAMDALQEVNLILVLIEPSCKYCQSSPTKLGNWLHLFLGRNIPGKIRVPLLGYKFDEHDRDSAVLRLQFARYPGARSGGGHRGKR
ncbi:hypothetical protein DH2020_048534 [Rehmannia glutinosa]|uniref:RRM domain-containing protein n=1 Tax=Rehmannia glutinosa TaxID=99300 RepID=A0ABR0U6L0_REHGL